MDYKKNLIKLITETVNDKYLDSDKSLLLSNELPKILMKSYFIDVENKDEIALLLTNTIQEITKDCHLKLRYAPDDIKAVTEISDKDKTLHLEKTKRDKLIHNFGFKELKFMDNEVGYLKLTRFSDTNFAGEIACSSMKFLSNSKNIIIDLRDNEGGHPSMVQLIASYFISGGIELYNFKYPKLNKTKQIYSLDYVQGGKLLDKNVYILINKNTFSAAEALAYCMQSLNKATIVGENSKGGANICSREIIGDEFILILPIGYPEDERTKSNWEGIGVIPDILETIDPLSRVIDMFV